MAIPLSKASKYKDAHKDRWLTLLGSVEFDLVEEGSMEEDIRDIGVELTPDF